MNTRRFEKVLSAKRLGSWILAASLVCAAIAGAADFAGENLEYEFGWKGIAAANASVQITEMACDGPCYAANIDIKGKPYLDMIWRVRDRIKTWAVKADYSPRKYVFYQREGGFELDTEIVLDKAEGLLKSTRFRKDKGKALTPKKAQAAGVYCPLSAILYMRAQPLEPGQRYTANVFDGKREHVIEWKVEEREKIKVGAGEFDAKRIAAQVIKSNVTDESSKVEKVRKVTIWVADAPNHLVLKVETQAFWGHIYGELIRK